MQVAFIGASVQVIFVKALKDLTDMLMVLFHVVQVDEDAIQVDEDTYVKHVGEDVVHEVLKSHWCISQTEGHNTPFKGAIAGAEGGFPFITFMDSIRWWACFRSILVYTEAFRASAKRP